MEPKMVKVLCDSFPHTKFEFRTGAGQTGPDVVWKGGQDPGFDFADFKPDTASGYAKFVTQSRRWGSEGWSGTPAPSGQVRAAIIVYTPEGTIYVADIATIGP